MLEYIYTLPDSVNSSSSFIYIKSRRDIDSTNYNFYINIYDLNNKNIVFEGLLTDKNRISNYVISGNNIYYLSKNELNILELNRYEIIKK